MKKISIVIPCYNEEKGIPSLVLQLNPAIKELEKEYRVELIFVDDGSTDRTNELLHKHYRNKRNVIILKHQRNKNLGAALKTGFSYASGDFIAALDSDCTYSPRLIKAMLSMMDEKTDIVTVSPCHPKGIINNVPAYRIFLSKSISMIYRILLNPRIYTYTAMVRVYRKDVIKKLKFKSNSFSGVTEIMIRAILKGYKVREFPAELNVRKYGESKMRILGIVGDHLKLITKIIMHKILGARI